MHTIVFHSIVVVETLCMFTVKHTLRMRHFRYRFHIQFYLKTIFYCHMFMVVEPHDRLTHHRCSDVTLDLLWVEIEFQPLRASQLQSCHFTVTCNSFECDLIDYWFRIEHLSTVTSMARFRLATAISCIIIYCYF